MKMNSLHYFCRNTRSRGPKKKNDRSPAHLPLAKQQWHRGRRTAFRFCSPPGVRSTSLGFIPEHNTRGLTCPLLYVSTQRSVTVPRWEGSHPLNSKLNAPVKSEVPTCASKRQDSFIGTYDRTSYPRRGRCITLAPSAPEVIPVIMKSRNTKVGISNLGDFLEEKYQVWRINKMLILSLL